MTRLQIYTLSLPLAYYTYDLRSDQGEFILGLGDTIEWDEPCPVDVPYPNDNHRRYQATESIHFSISCKNNVHIDDKGNSSYEMPDKQFMCVVSGIVAESKIKARELVDESILKACKSLSVLMSLNNGNKHGYQPRVEPMFNQQEWSIDKYEPYEALIEEAYGPSEYIDENGNKVIRLYASDSIDIEVSVHHVLFGKMDISRFFTYYDLEKSPALSFVVDEYYTALGRESVSSKFFHLFTIIEFIEREYADLADTEKVFDETDMQTVLKCIEQIDMPKGKKDRLKDSFNRIMDKITVLGRNAKLVNILHKMGIKEFNDCGTHFVVDKTCIEELTDLRNIYFHGEGRKAENSVSHISVDLAVTKLMYICEKVIVYIAGNNE